ncbi:MAG: hypothetical protein R3C68_11280 [Myxococcota bacterium]
MFAYTPSKRLKRGKLTIDESTLIRHLVTEVWTVRERRQKFMALSEDVKKNWIEIQKKHTKPVNAIGMPVKSKRC